MNHVGFLKACGFQIFLKYIIRKLIFKWMLYSVVTTIKITQTFIISFFSRIPPPITAKHIMCLTLRIWIKG